MATFRRLEGHVPAGLVAPTSCCSPAVWADGRRSRASRRGSAASRRGCGDSGVLRQRAARNIPMPDINRRQARCRGAAVLLNPNGTAPGLWIDAATASVLLPGPRRWPMSTRANLAETRTAALASPARDQDDGRPESGVEGRPAALSIDGELGDSARRFCRASRSSCTSGQRGGSDAMNSRSSVRSTSCRCPRRSSARRTQPLQVVGDALRVRGATSARRVVHRRARGRAATDVPGSSEDWRITAHANQVNRAARRPPRSSSHGAVSEPVAEGWCRAFASASVLRRVGHHGDCRTVRRECGETRRHRGGGGRRRLRSNGAHVQVSRRSPDGPAAGDTSRARHGSPAPGATVRLFLALKPDRPAEARLAHRVLEIQDALGDAAPALRWIPASNIHLTLHFLGEVPPAHLPRLRDALTPPLPMEPFEVEVASVGAFPPAGPPRVIWLDIARGAALVSSLHAELGRRLSSAGVAVETRPFSPHLTLARVPDRERARVKHVRAALQRIPTAAIAWTAGAVVPFRSDSSGPVPRYDVVQETLLTPHASYGTLRRRARRGRLGDGPRRSPWPERPPGDPVGSGSRAAARNRRGARQPHVPTPPRKRAAARSCRCACGHPPRHRTCRRMASGRRA